MGCTLCPRKCGADRTVSVGFCGMSDKLKAARAGLHFWEEPCISGTNGSGTVFFSGCVMRCCYCQNHEISAQGNGKEISVSRLAEIFLELQGQGAHNINLVSPTHFVPQIIEALDIVKGSLKIPVVYNTGGYERIETLKMLEGYIDIYLPDIKYFSDEAAKLSQAPNYFDTAMEAVGEMVRQTGKPSFDGELLKKGVIVRHMVLPYMYKDSVEVIRRLGERFGDDILFSLMSQYTPFHKAKDDPRLGRRITTFEYRKALDAVTQAGLSGYMQQRSSAKEEYTPAFDLSGL
ncbi:MAG: radical SAM protein [Ruminococcaceae bacterium]|nr:radical SAM protein [Oscillospiraceae bacterium]